MKILLVSPQPFFRVRGTPINIRNLVTAMGEAGHEVDLLCYPFGDPVDIPGVRILRSPRIPGIRDVKVGPSFAKFPLDAAMALRACARMIRHRYDAVHAVEEAAFFMAPVARLKRIPLIVDMDSLISHQLAYSGFVRCRPLLALVEAMERRVLRRAARVVTVCQALTDSALSLAPGARVVQIEDAPLTDSFQPDKPGARALREEFDLEQRPCIVYTGNLEAYQGIPLLIEAMVHLGDRVPEAIAVVVGGEERHRLQLEQTASEKGVGERMCFTGPMPMERMPACMTLASVLVSPRIKGENTALKLYSYMQTGKPIVATNLPTHTQVLDEETGWLCDPEPVALAAALGEALQSGDRDRRGTNAARKVEERYGLPRFYNQVQSLLSELEGGK